MSDGWQKSEPEKGVLRFSRADGIELMAPALIGGRYAVDGILSAAGGFGVIYTASDWRLRNRRVLVKARRYPPELFRFREDRARDEEIIKLRKQTRFEWQCLLHFRQQGESRIPNINDVCEDFAPALAGPHRDANGEWWRFEDETVVQTEPYIVLQAIHGHSLGEYIDKGRQNPHWERQVLQLALELCTILGGFHRGSRDDRQAYFIYQDLKPANIIISHDEFFTLIDFGAMTLVTNDEAGQSYSNWEGYGSPGLGTWGYKAPETNPQEGRLGQLDQRVDVYALGATLFHLLTGEDPSRATEYGPLAVDGLKTRSPTTSALVRKALENDRDQRYATMADMKQDIFQALRELRER